MTSEEKPPSERRQSALVQLLADLEQRSGPARLSFEEVLADCAALARRVASTWDDFAAEAGLLGDGAVLAVEDSWPADVRASFERLGLYDSYSPTTLRGTFAHLPEAGRNGLEHSVKGTEFEAEAVRRLNDGNVPGFDADKYHAALATTTTQAGWDAVVSDKSGHIVGHLQMKATDGSAVIAEHLRRYPEIQDVVTTHEGALAADHAHLGGNVVDSSVSDATLDAQVSGVTEHLDLTHAIHEAIPVGSAAAIALMALRRLGQEESFTEVGRSSARRLLSSVRTHLTAHGAVLLTHNPHAAPVFLGGRLLYRLRVGPSGRVVPSMVDRSGALSSLLDPANSEARPLAHLAVFADAAAARDGAPESRHGR